MVNGFAFISETRFAVTGHDTFTCECTDRGAKIYIWALAKLAFTAIGLITRNHMVPRGKTCDTFTDTLNNPGSFMAKDAWKEAFRVMAVQGVSVSVT